MKTQQGELKTRQHSHEMKAELRRNALEKFAKYVFRSQDAIKSPNTNPSAHRRRCGASLASSVNREEFEALRTNYKLSRLEYNRVHRMLLQAGFRNTRRGSLMNTFANLTLNCR